MPTLELTADQKQRIEQLRAALADEHAGPYATVGTTETVTYLLDLADAVDDPGRRAEPTQPSGSDPVPPFDTAAAREALEARTLRHSDPDAADRPDLQAVATAFDVTGRSDMVKDELIDAIIQAATELAVDPFAAVGIDLVGDDAAGSTSADEAETADDAETSAQEHETAESATDAGSAIDAESATDAEPEAANDGGAGQLNAMMRLLETHADKWRKADGDARYEVDLPDGSVETARTKDDVRALLFKNY